MPKSRKVKITTEALNSYGTWLLTSGGNLESFKANPVLLYMHERGRVIGSIANLSIQDNAVVGELVFDEVGELSKEVAAKWDKGSLNAVSAGIRVVEWSEDPAYLKQGQTSPTIVKWTLREVSVVDIPANPEAIRLYDEDGNQLNLSDSGSARLPKLNIKTNTKMELKQLALLLGLSEDATMEQIQAKIKELMDRDSEMKALREQNEKISLAAINAAVDSAISEKRLTADKRDQFVQLGQQVGLETLNATLSAMQPAAKASSFIEGGSAPAGEYQKLSDVPSDKIMELREKEPAKYAKLYKAEYGIDCEF